MLVRRLIDEDIPALAVIISSLPLWQRYGITQQRAESTIREAQRTLSVEDSEWLVAEVDGKPAGFVWILHKGCFGLSGYIKMIGVEASCQGKGMGRALLEAAESRIFARGPNVFLLVSHFNDAAIRFYESNGYTYVGRLSQYVLPDVDELMYRKTLSPIRG